MAYIDFSRKFEKNFGLISNELDVLDILLKNYLDRKTDKLIQQVTSTFSILDILIKETNKIKIAMATYFAENSKKISDDEQKNFEIRIQVLNEYLKRYENNFNLYKGYKK